MLADFFCATTTEGTASACDIFPSFLIASQTITCLSCLSHAYMRHLPPQHPIPSQPLHTILPLSSVPPRPLSQSSHSGSDKRTRRCQARLHGTHGTKDTGQLGTETPITRAPPHSPESGEDHSVSSQCSILHDRISCREAFDSSAPRSPARPCSIQQRQTLPYPGPPKPASQPTQPRNPVQSAILTVLGIVSLASRPV